MRGYIGTTGQVATLALILAERETAKVRATVQILTTGIKQPVGTVTR